MQRAGIRAIHVPYRGAGPAVQDLLGGQIQFMFLDMSSALGQIKAGKLRALAVAPKTRFEGLPEVPTMAEQGSPEVQAKPDVEVVYAESVEPPVPVPHVPTGRYNIARW